MARTDGLTSKGTTGDASAIFAVIAAGPFLLPRLGIRLEALAWCVPLVLLCFATAASVRAVQRDAPWRATWQLLALASATAAAASALAVVLAATDTTSRLAFYIGAGASALLLAAAVAAVWSDRGLLRAERAVDALVPGVAVAALAGWFAVLPGLRDGDALLTAIVVVDVAAALAFMIALAARDDDTRRPALRALVAALLVVSFADGLISASADGRISPTSWLLAALWGVAAYLLATAPDCRPAERPTGPGSDRWVHARVIAPFSALLVLPAATGALAVADRLTGGAVAWFGAWFGAGLVLAILRQVDLVVGHRRAVARERALREAVDRRNEELEALTGLATTMTQTLEEAPIVERGLDALRLAARGTSAALHLQEEPGRHALRATGGAWADDHVWARRSTAPEAPEVFARGRRQIAHLPLVVREHRLGWVTLVRPAEDPFCERDAELLGLLADQLAVAVQNARDYREKLDQAVRDPLTGLYNRRYLYEALGNEVSRHERYGSQASLVILDVDDFKAVNDTLGHAAGDDVLREIARIGEELVRPVDSFARLGGEEFALLLPETDPLDAHLAAERLRTAVARATILAGRRVTVSAGVAGLPDDATTVEDLVRKADAAMYWAKRTGKNSCAVASEVMVDDSVPRTPSTTPFHAIVTALDAQQFSTRDHSENVAVYAAALAERLGVRGERLTKLRRAALFHDIGKLTVSSGVLTKPGPLTPAERAEIESHAAAGGTMLQHGGLGTEARWVRHHHERVDGCGYPDGLAGEAIPLEARIIFVADSFEAMTSDRPYRRGMPVEDALEELQRCAGTQFDPSVVAELRDLVLSGELPLLAIRC